MKAYTLVEDVSDLVGISDSKLFLLYRIDPHYPHPNLTAYDLWVEWCRNREIPEAMADFLLDVYTEFLPQRQALLEVNNGKEQTPPKMSF